VTNGATADPALETVAAEICPGAPLDLGIVLHVKVLRDAGIETFESCEGGEGHAYAYPTVRFHGDVGAGWRALAVCMTHALPVRELARVWQITDHAPTGPYWELVFRGR
jgi:hypothetical protein